MLDVSNLPYVGQLGYIIIPLALVAGAAFSIEVWYGDNGRSRKPKSPSTGTVNGQTQPKTRIDEDPGVESENEEENVPFVPITRPHYDDDEAIQRSRHFYEAMDRRRSIRVIASDPIPRKVIDNIIRTAGTSPSGAHSQPWTYVAVESPVVKATIRFIVEEEEELNYKKRMGHAWVTELKKFRTDWNKPYLTEAPYLILVFRQAYGIKTNGRHRKHYYNEISTCISIGILLTAIEHCGLSTVLTTPLNCGLRLQTLLERPPNEKLVALLPVGFAPEDATVPDLKRKSLQDIMVYV